MFDWLRNIFGRRRTLDEVLFATRRIKVHGIIFHVRKVNPIDFASGAKALQMHFQTWKTADEKKQLEILGANEGKIREHYVDVIMAGVVTPKLSRKKDEPGAIFVEHLFTDWSLASELYLKIIENSQGKKKPRFST